MRALLLVGLVGCKDSSPPQSELSDQIVKSVETKLGESPPPAASRPPGTASDCSGAKVDLVRALTSKACDAPKPLDSYARPPAGIDLELSPAAPKLRSGDALDFELVLANRTQAAITFDTYVSLGLDKMFVVELHQRGKLDDEPIDLDPGDCPVESSFMNPRTSRITIAAGGRAVYPLRLAGTKDRLDKDCKRRPVGALPKGAFDLVVMTPWALPAELGVTMKQVVAPITIE